MVVQGPWKIAAICISVLIGKCRSFAPYPLQVVGSRTPSMVWTDRRASSSSLTARRRNRHYSDDNDDNTARGDRGGAIPQLPAIGASSYHSRPSVTSSSSTTFGATNSNAAFVGANFQLQYTCKVCETRNCHIVSRIAYRQGMVVAVCKGCGSKHLIADHLGTISGSLGGGTNIEDYFKIKNGDKEMGDVVNRVSQDVFNLEKLLAFDTEGGAISGEDGAPMLE